MRKIPQLKQLDSSISKENLIEVGFMAKRNMETGEFYDKTYPIYQEATPEMKKHKLAFTGMIIDEFSDMLEDFMEIQVAEHGYTTIWVSVIIKN